MEPQKTFHNLHPLGFSENRLIYNLDAMNSAHAQAETVESDLEMKIGKELERIQSSSMEYKETILDHLEKQKTQFDEVRRELDALKNSAMSSPNEAYRELQCQEGIDVCLSAYNKYVQFLADSPAYDHFFAEEHLQFFEDNMAYFHAGLSEILPDPTAEIAQATQEYTDVKNQIEMKLRAMADQLADADTPQAREAIREQTQQDLLGIANAYLKKGDVRKHPGRDPRVAQKYMELGNDLIEQILLPDETVVAQPATAPAEEETAKAAADEGTEAEPEAVTEASDEISQDMSSRIKAVASAPSAQKQAKLDELVATDEWKNADDAKKGRIANKLNIDDTTDGLGYALDGNSIKLEFREVKPTEGYERQAWFAALPEWAQGLVSFLIDQMKNLKEELKAAKEDKEVDETVRDAKSKPLNSLREEWEALLEKYGDSKDPEVQRMLSQMEAEIRRREAKHYQEAKQAERYCRTRNVPCDVKIVQFGSHQDAILVMPGETALAVYNGMPANMRPAQMQKTSSGLQMNFCNEPRMMNPNIRRVRGAVDQAASLRSETPQARAPSGPMPTPEQSQGTTGHPMHPTPEQQEQGWQYADIPPEDQA